MSIKKVALVLAMFFCTNSYGGVYKCADANGLSRIQKLPVIAKMMVNLLLIYLQHQKYQKNCRMI